MLGLLKKYLQVHWNSGLATFHLQLFRNTTRMEHKRTIKTVQTGYSAWQSAIVTFFSAIDFDAINGGRTTWNTK